MRSSTVSARRCRSSWVADVMTRYVCPATLSWIAGRLMTASYHRPRAMEMRFSSGLVLCGGQSAVPPGEGAPVILGGPVLRDAVGAWVLRGRGDLRGRGCAQQRGLCALVG